MKRLGAVLLGTLLLAGCTGVPSSSAPETVLPPVSAPALLTPSAPADLDGDPRAIVEGFLAANLAAGGAGYSTAYAYLTPGARTHWLPTSATIIADDYSVSTYDAKQHTVTVQGRPVGTLSPSGIYAPSGGGTQSFVFTLARTKGQFRISKPAALGLLLTDSDFARTYQQRVLYFDNAVPDDPLVPDLRWSALDDRAALTKWLIGQLAAGPRPSLQNAVSLDTLPAQLDPQQITVELGDPTVIGIPGASQLDAGARNRLAAQLSETLFQPLSGGDMTITDGTNQVTIPSVGGTVFNASDFARDAGPQLPAASVYYVNDGRIRDESGRVVPLAGPGPGYVTSFAIGRTAPGTPLLIAAVTGSGTAQRLAVGTQRAGMRQTSVTGQLSRPSFAPDRPEVWIGDGAKVYRLNVDGAPVHARQVQLPSSLSGGRVVALRFSPEGARVALVVAAGGGAPQLYVGSIVRSAGPGPGQVRVDRVEQISPTGVAVQDVAWLDAVRLFAIGYVGSGQDWRVFETGVDGTEWTNEGLGNLPSHPDSVAAATGASVWVADNGHYVWKQSGTTWVSPGPTGQTPGSAPVYLE